MNFPLIKINSIILMNYFSLFSSRLFNYSKVRRFASAVCWWAKDPKLQTLLDELVTYDLSSALRAVLTLKMVIGISRFLCLMLPCQAQSAHCCSFLPCGSSRCFFLCNTPARFGKSVQQTISRLLHAPN